MPAIFKAAKVVASVREIGLELKRSLKLCLCLFITAMQSIHAGEVIVGVRTTRVEPYHLREVIGGIIEQSHFVMEFPQVLIDGA